MEDVVPGPAAPTDDRRSVVADGPEVGQAALDVEAVDLDLTRVEESLRLLDDADTDPASVVAWLEPVTPPG